MESEQKSDPREQFTVMNQTTEIIQQAIKEQNNDDNMSLNSADINRKEAYLKCEQRRKKFENAYSIPGCIIIRIFVIIILVFIAADLVCLRNDHTYWLLLLTILVVIFDCIWLIWKRHVRDYLTYFKN
jgi:hypothetical protein